MTLSKDSIHCTEIVQPKVTFTDIMNGLLDYTRGSKKVLQYSSLLRSLARRRAQHNAIQFPVRYLVRTVCRLSYYWPISDQAQRCSTTPFEITNDTTAAKQLCTTYFEHPRLHNFCKEDSLCTIQRIRSVVKNPYEPVTFHINSFHRQTEAFLDKTCVLYSNQDQETEIRTSPCLLKLGFIKLE